MNKFFVLKDLLATVSRISFFISKRTSVFEFKRGRASVGDEPRSGWSKNSRTLEIIERVYHIFSEVDVSIDLD